VDYTPYAGATELIHAIDKVTKAPAADNAIRKTPDFIEVRSLFDVVQLKASASDPLYW
jgi:hypothetical protein